MKSLTSRKYKTSISVKIAQVPQHRHFVIHFFTLILFTAKHLCHEQDDRVRAKEQKNREHSHSLSSQPIKTLIWNTSDRSTVHLQVRVYTFHPPTSPMNGSISYEPSFVRRTDDVIPMGGYRMSDTVVAVG